jgi:hypothetical protein
MAQTLGIVDLIWKGTRIPVEKGAKFKPGGLKNNPVMTGRRIDRSEEFLPGEVSGTTILQRGQSFLGMYSTGEGELQVVCDTGQSLIWNDAFMGELIEATGGEGGKIELKWVVGEPEELLNG